jgi:hypothetical protein
MLDFDEGDFSSLAKAILDEELNRKSIVETNIVAGIDVTGDSVSISDIEATYNIGTDMADGESYSVDMETGEILSSESTEQTEFLGFQDIEMQTYRNANGLANSELQIFSNNPSAYVWAKSAPSDPTKADASDFGTALHCSLLEPNMYDDLIIIASTKGRTAQAFIDMQNNNKGNIILTDSEDDQIKLMTESANCHPMLKRILDAQGACEGSIFVDDPATGLRLKIRPDKIIDSCNPPIFNDVKSTKSLDDWRSDVQWKNPLFDMNYGFTAAYYMYVGSIHYGVEMKTYNFCVISKSADMGRYPVSVFTISKDQCIEYGFWNDMIKALASFKKCQEENKWLSYEQFPEFRIFNDGEVTVTFEDEK